jgi:sterol desaturase/sphingolipid hydroxylase (fatty acid hydroxylase superfamily)
MSTYLADLPDWVAAVWQSMHSAWASLHAGLFEQVFVPLMYGLGWGQMLGDGYVAALWLMAGCAQLGVMCLVLRPLEHCWPVEVGQDPRARQVDVIYTLIHRLGVFRLTLFFLCEPFWSWLFGQLSLWGVGAWHLDAALVRQWPALAGHAWVLFLAYLVVFDAVDYLIHRAQHHFSWWWNLHAVHHSQRHMSLWSDNRNHLLDDVLRDAAFVLVAKAVGVAPGQFVALVALTQLFESLAHANLRWHFGRWGERLLVSPRYHRLHHSAGLGHESRGEGSLGGHNFAVLFPIWDVLGGTSRFGGAVAPTGIRDQWPGNDGRSGRDYGDGFWAQQTLAFKRWLGKA